MRVELQIKESSASRSHNSSESPCGSVTMWVISFRVALTAENKLMIFWGYDPGGRGNNGVAAVRMNSEGEIVEKPKCGVVQTAAAALVWLNENGPACALGVDTLLAWSRTGSRSCDQRLRKRYRGVGGQSVVEQNSLYSSMTINGAIVASEARKHQEKLTLCECHPKLLINAGLLPSQLQELHAAVNDHAGDALIAAWCASRRHYRVWDTDLFEGDGQLLWPAGNASYPWPEDLGLT